MKYFNEIYLKNRNICFIYICVRYTFSLIIVNKYTSLGQFRDSAATFEAMHSSDPPRHFQLSRASRELSALAKQKQQEAIESAREEGAKVASERSSKYFAKIRELTSNRLYD